MNRIIAVLYILYFISYMLGCATSGDYEIHLFMDRQTEEVEGYIKIDGEKHPIRASYD